jgi:hypothetical protein
MEKINQSNKRMVWELWQAIDANPKQAYEFLKANCHHNVLFDGPHPINRLADPDGIAAGYWQPFYAAFPDLTRRPYIFMGGTNFDGTTWVASTGDFIGTFANEWLVSQLLETQFTFDMVSSVKFMIIRLGKLYFC